MKTGEVWTARSANRKTGDMPQLWVGSSPDETRASCEAVACPLLDVACYAWRGTPRMAMRSAQKRSEREPASLGDVLQDRAPTARAVRLGAIGDPAALGARRLRAISAKVKAAGLALLGYTHGWRKRPALAPLLMASCETLSEADTAVSLGWRATVILPSATKGKSFETPAGRRGIVCPAQQLPGRVTCNTCKLCDASRPGPVIGFLKH